MEPVIIFLVISGVLAIAGAIYTAIEVNEYLKELNK